VSFQVKIRAPAALSQCIQLNDSQTPTEKARDLRTVKHYIPAASKEKIIQIFKSLEESGLRHNFQIQPANKASEEGK